MDETDLGPAYPDWQDSSTYDYTAQLTSRGWAWEFLRRNHHFQNDVEDALRHAHRSELTSGTSLTVLSPQDVDLSRWGLLFCQLDPQSCQRLLEPWPM
ncbi:DUF6499 domain-containing protein [Mesorhizobium sp. CA8]|uniref:transcriptional regulator domain-containing protein n=1 Tax=Mesorhizobium sp. CA8 TaxID=2876637 RepID=UPI001CCA3CD7|nr:DUF6499 domain-containing protein [Mesorhizobium sp. CA8]MBZ9763325.1 DUF6499 domain-containing protein [Mesorhizobium sp. CA8]